MCARFLTNFGSLELPVHFSGFYFDFSVPATGLQRRWKEMKGRKNSKCEENFVAVRLFSSFYAVFRQRGAKYERVDNSCKI